MVSSRRLAALATALFLAAAAPAGAQSAGDDQYEDPFGGGGAGTNTDAPADKDSSTDTESPTDTDSAAPAPSAGDAPAPADDGSSQPTAPAPGGEQLPVTGVDAGLVALAGTILLAGGVALRVRLRDER